MPQQRPNTSGCDSCALTARWPSFTQEAAVEFQRSTTHINVNMPAQQEKPQQSSKPFRCMHTPKLPQGGGAEPSAHVALQTY